MRFPNQLLQQKSRTPLSWNSLSSYRWCITGLHQLHTGSVLALVPPAQKGDTMAGGREGRLSLYGSTPARGNKSNIPKPSTQNLAV